MITTSALAENTVAVVLAGGKGTRLGALTRHVCKPALPFGAAYRKRGVIVDSECRVPDGTVIDHAWRGRGSYQPQEPVVVTAEDFSPELVSSCA